VAPAESPGPHTEKPGGWLFGQRRRARLEVTDEGVEFVDVRFCDLPGVIRHFTVPASFSAVFSEG
jgi:hypothetical protein